jgi:hypothetical protein
VLCCRFIGLSFVRMSDPQSSEAARLLALQRWGTTKLDRLADELVSRRDELDPNERERLARALADDNNNEGPEAA